MWFLSQYEAQSQFLHSVLPVGCPRMVTVWPGLLFTILALLHPGSGAQPDQGGHNVGALSIHQNTMIAYFQTFCFGSVTKRKQPVLTSLYEFYLLPAGSDVHVLNPSQLKDQTNHSVKRADLRPKGLHQQGEDDLIEIFWDPENMEKGKIMRSREATGFWALRG